MAVIGIHTLLYTSEPDELRGVLSDVFGFDHVDSGGGWLIFGLPPAEMGVHPHDSTMHEVSMMCDDIDATMAELREKGIEFKHDPEDHGYGMVTYMVLPGGLEMQLYEPRHDTMI